MSGTVTQTNVSIFGGTDGSITANDASLIMKYSTSMIGSFPAVKTKSAFLSTVDVDISVENNELVFRSLGELYCLNLLIKENYQQLDKPIIQNDSIISILNPDNNQYSFGLASAFAQKENSILMKIPLKSTTPATQGDIVMDMVINTEVKTKTIHLSTTIPSNTNSIKVYP